MKNPDFKFNKPFRSDDEILSEISLQHKLDTADAISKNMANAEINAHVYRAKVAVLKELLVQEQFSEEAVANIKHLISLVEERLSAYEKRRKLITLKQETRVIQEPLEDGDEWKKGTEHASSHEEVNVYSVVRPGVKESVVDKLENDMDQVGDEISFTYDHIQEFFPEAFAKIEQAFNDMQRENRTN